MPSNTYTQHFNLRRTPQNEPIPGTDQKANNAGGFAWQIDNWSRLRRFLVLGTEGGTFYVAEKKLTRDNATALLACIAEDGKRVVDEILSVSEGGRAAKNDPALFALAGCIGTGDQEVKAYALSVLPRVARIGTHLFHLLPYIEAFCNSGSRSVRRALGEWYNSKAPEKLAYQMVKYQARDGWSHRDVLRVAHPSPATPEHHLLFQWAVKGEFDGDPLSEVKKDSSIRLMFAFEEAKRAQSPKEICTLIETYRLPREAIPTQFLTNREVWESLLQSMPMTAMIRNLATMTRVGLLAPMSEATGKVIAELGNAERIRSAKVHPLAVLAALRTYEQGQGVRGQSSWTPVAEIVNALDAGFYTAFENVETTGKRWLLALDVSGSMCSPDIAGMSGISPRVGSAAMALVTAAKEPQHHIVGFTSSGADGFSAGSSRAGYRRDSISGLAISPRQRLDDVIRYIDGMDFGGTDCSLPMIYARERKIPVDTFVVYTDSETWAGNIHPSQALREYRETMGIDARLIVCGMVANDFSIADPNDPGMLDVVGFSTDTPALISGFAKGEI